MNINVPVDSVEQSNSLADLAARIKVEHEASGRAIKQGLDHAIACGRLLIEAKAQLNKHGQWLPWLREHCGRMPERTAQHYMRLARHADEIRNVADLSAREAAALIAKPPADEYDAILAEGEAILNRIREADAGLIDEVRERMERLRAFAISIYELNPSDRHEALAALSPEDRRSLPRWRKINEDAIMNAQWQISCLSN
jgi:hypothetical protein